MSDQVSQKISRDIRYWFDLISRENLVTHDDALIPQSLITDSLIDEISLCLKNGSLKDQPVFEIAKTNLGIERDRYIGLVREIGLRSTIKTLKKNENIEEIELMHLVRILDETDRGISKISEKIQEYLLAVSSYDPCNFSKINWTQIQAIAKSHDHPLAVLCRDILLLKESRTLISRTVIKLSEIVMPNMSALCGPIVTARLLSSAGGRQSLASMPASSLQVMGAGPALFSHLLSGTPSPKHGIIYEYKGVHQARRQIRGRISRVLACQLVIAARIDHYRGMKDELFLNRAFERLCRAKNSR
jgi:nucleolar protein 56